MRIPLKRPENVRKESVLSLCQGQMLLILWTLNCYFIIILENICVSYFDTDTSILSFCDKQVSLLLFFNLPMSHAVPLVHFFGNSAEVSGTWNDYLTAEPGLCSSVISMAGGQRELWKQRAVSAWTVSLEHEFQRGCRKEIMTLTDQSCPVSIVTDHAAFSAISVKKYIWREVVCVCVCVCVCVLYVCMVCLSVWCLCSMYMSLSSEQNKV